MLLMLSNLPVLSNDTAGQFRPHGLRLNFITLAAPARPAGAPRQSLRGPVRPIALSIVLVAVTLAQTPQPDKKIEFEVASIRPSNQKDSQDIDMNQGRFQTRNATLKVLIADAYGIDIKEIFGGPKWVDSDGFDINAKIPEEFAHGGTKEKLLRPMVQSLLADRFQLVIHREPRQISGYFLVVAKKWPKMEPAKAGEEANLHSNRGHLSAENVTIETLARHLSYDTEKLVVDRTELTGGFDFKLDWMPEKSGPKPEPFSDGGPSIFTAVQEQLGLRLESAQVPIQAIVIDRAEKPDPN